MAAITGLDDSLMASVVNGNFKVIAEGPIADLQMERKRIDGILDAALTNNLSTLGSAQPTVTDAVAQQMQVGGGLAQTMTQLASAQTAGNQSLSQAIVALAAAVVAATTGGTPAKA